jgi:hypothetical protein
MKGWNSFLLHYDDSCCETLTRLEPAPAIIVLS